LYIGRLSWDRCGYVKDPRTGKRVARPHAPDSWEIAEIPTLRIVDQELWDAVKARQVAIGFAVGRDDDGNALNRAHRRDFLLSGLLTCGCCGGGYTIMAKDRYGCATRRAKGTCDNTHTISRQRVEQRVLSGLKDRLLAPELVAEFVRAFADEMAEADRQAAGARSQLDAQFAEVERRLEGVLRAIENGAWSDALHQRLGELEARRASLRREGESVSEPAPKVRLHPNAAGLYRAKVAALEASLNAPEIKAEASDALRALIDKVVLTPDPDAPDRLRAELHGDLAEILWLGEAVDKRLTPQLGNVRRNEKLPRTDVLRSQLSVVAGTGFEPVTFRL
jgi:hypothetical protein